MAANSHPYISGAGAITAVINHLRRVFPQTVNAETLKKLGIAPNNESYLINILVFLGLIDEEGKRLDTGHAVMTTHKEEDFHKAFGGLIQKAYADLFSTLGEDAWKKDRDTLVTYFRQSDKTSDIIGRRQAGTFLALAALAGHGEVPSEPSKPKAAATKAKPPATKTAKKKVETVVNSQPNHNSSGSSNGNLKRDMALTVRIEINLPAGGTQETYDAIFKSIKANLYP
jgi:Family of unknown function (DUF5343)